MNRKILSMPMRETESALLNSAGLFNRAGYNDSESQNQRQISINKFVKAFPFSSFNFSPLPSCTPSLGGNI